MGRAIEEIGSAKSCITGDVLKEAKRVVMEKGLDAAEIYAAQLTGTDQNTGPRSYISSDPGVSLTGVILGHNRPCWELVKAMIITNKGIINSKITLDGLK